MKIGMVRYWGKTVHFPSLGGLLGYDSMAHICDDATFYNHVAASQKEFDFVLFIATPEGVEWLKANRPAKWGKVLYCCYRPVIEMNRQADIDNVRAFDAICTICDPQMLSVFGKPVVETLLPYAPDADEALRLRPKKNKVCLIIKHMNDVMVNYLATLAAFAKTSNLSGIVSTNCAYPYHEDTEKLRSLIVSLGLGDRIEVVRPNSRQEHLESVADCQYMLSMDARQSYGRWVVDAASLGMTSVGTYSTMQELLFSDQMVGPADIDRAAALMGKVAPLPDLGVFEPNRIRAALERDLAQL